MYAPVYPLSPYRGLPVVGDIVSVVFSTTEYPAGYGVVFIVFEYVVPKLATSEPVLSVYCDAIAGILYDDEDYGMGSSRDWAAKGTNLLGVKAVITKSFERIHRSNLVGMGVLPCNFVNKADYDKVVGLADATFDLVGIDNDLKPQQQATLVVHPAQGESFNIPVIVRIDTPVEKDYYRAGGILPYVLSQILDQQA